MKARHDMSYDLSILTKLYITEDHERSYSGHERKAWFALFLVTESKVTTKG